MNDSTLHFTKTHEWVITNEGEATLGITEHAQAQLGDIVFIQLPNIGRNVSAGDEVAVIESVKAAADVYTPLSGSVTAINNALVDNPELVNNSPQDEGWLIKLQINQPLELHNLLNAPDYQACIDKDC